jgi:hypothetical protein
MASYSWWKGLGPATVPPAGVERYEVTVFEVPSAGPISGVTDTLGGATGSVTGVTGKLLGGGGEEKQR